MKTFLNYKNIRYQIHHDTKVIYCIIDVYIDWEKMPFFWYIKFTRYYTPSISFAWGNKFTQVIGKAKCRDGDVYDEIKGKRIAECKAKAKALRMYSKVMSMIVADFYNNLEDARILFFKIVDCRRKVNNHIKELSQ